MSALGCKADVYQVVVNCPLVASSGNSENPTNEAAPFALYRLISGDLYAAHDALSALGIVKCDVLGTAVIPKGD